MQSPRKLSSHLAVRHHATLADGMNDARQSAHITVLSFQRALQAMKNFTSQIQFRKIQTVYVCGWVWNERIPDSQIPRLKHSTMTITLHPPLNASPFIHSFIQQTVTIHDDLATVQIVFPSHLGMWSFTLPLSTSTKGNLLQRHSKFLAFAAE